MASELQKIGTNLKWAEKSSKYEELIEAVSPSQITSWNTYKRPYVNLDLLLYYFNVIPEVNSVITKIASKVADLNVLHIKEQSNGKIKILGKTDVLKLLDKPNKFDNGRNFKINSISNFLALGDTYISKLYSVGFNDIPYEIFNLPSNIIFPIPNKSYGYEGIPITGQDFRYNNIVKYNMKLDNGSYIGISSDNMIHIKDSNLCVYENQNLKGMPRLFSAVRSIETLKNNYETINTLLSNQGALGILSQNNPDKMLDWIIDGDEKEKILGAFYSYGTTQGKKPLAITGKDLKFINVTQPLDTFMPIDLKDSEFATLCNCFQVSDALFNSHGSNSKFNNTEMFTMSMYLDCVIPIANLFYEGLSDGFGLTEKGEKLVVDTNSITALQNIKKVEAEKIKVFGEGLIQLINNGLLTKNQALDILSQNTTLNTIGLGKVSDKTFDEYRESFYVQDANRINGKDKQVQDTNHRLDTGINN